MKNKYIKFYNYFKIKFLKDNLPMFELYSIHITICAFRGKNKLFCGNKFGSKN